MKKFVFEEDLEEEEKDGNPENYSQNLNANVLAKNVNTGQWVLNYPVNYETKSLQFCEICSGKLSQVEENPEIVNLMNMKLNEKDISDVEEDKSSEHEINA